MRELKLPHAIEYTGRGTLKLSDVADALLAQEALVTYLPKVLEDVFPGLHVSHVKISLKDVESGSLKEEFFVSLIVAFQDDLNQIVIDGVERMTGVEVLERYDKVVTLLIVLVVLYGARFVYDKLRGKTAEPPASIQGDYNRVLNITADNLHISSEALDGAIDNAVKAQGVTNITKATAKFMKPAKRMEAAPITAFSEDVISTESVKEFPVEAELLGDDRSMTPLPDVRLQILALDRQKRATGWAAAFPDKEVDASRISMDLYPSIDLERLRKAEFVRADVILEQKPNASGRLRPSKIHLIRLIDVLD